MKRGAEHQLSKDDNPDDDDVEEISNQSFKTADESILATRKIKAMPKRSMGGAAAPPPPPLNGIASEPSRFGGFSGFGSPSSSFSFTPPPAPTASTFGSPSIAPSASCATKTFASYLEPSSFNPAPPSQSSTPDPKEDPAPLKYYSSLRGLNVSVVSAITQALETDPFVDIADVLERYKSLRVNIQKEYDDRANANKPASTSAPAATSSIPTPPPKPAMPVPPSSFAGFGATSSPSAFSSPATGGFVPKLDSTSSPSGFSFPPPPTSTPSSSTFVFATPDSSSKTSLFGSSSTSATDSSVPKPSSTPSSSTTAFDPTNFSSSGSAKSPFSFSSPKPPFSDASKPESAPTPATPSPFGKTSTFGSTSNPFGSEKPSQPPNPFSGMFGSGSTSKPSPFGSFGKPSGSIGNPVGFGFGTPPKTPEADGGSAFSSTATNGFSFGASAPAVETQAPEGTPEEEPGDVAAGDEDDGSKLFPTKTHDQEGEGEEDEETTHTVKAKVYKMAKSESQWTDMGVGMLRLKKHTVTGSRRVLLRNSSTGKIIINFIIYAGLSPSSATHFVSFVGHEKGASITFKLRLKTEQDAGELKAAMDREIALVQVKTP